MPEIILAFAIVAIIIWGFWPETRIEQSPKEEAKSKAA